MIPEVDFFGTSVSRLTLGDNPFNGHSYIHQVHTGEEMMDYYTADNCVRTLLAAEEQGVNTYIALADPFTLRVIRQYRLEGGSMHVLFQSYPALDLEVMESEGKLMPADYRVIARGPRVPYCVFSAAKALPESTFQEIRKALFAVNAETVAAVDGEVLKVLKSALVDGFVPLEEKEFDPVRAMAKRCNLPPYDKY